LKPVILLILFPIPSAHNFLLTVAITTVGPNYNDNNKKRE